MDLEVAIREFYYRTTVVKCCCKNCLPRCSVPAALMQADRIMMSHCVAPTFQHLDLLLPLIVTHCLEQTNSYYLRPCCYLNSSNQLLWSHKTPERRNNISSNAIIATPALFSSVVFLLILFNYFGRQDHR